MKRFFWVRHLVQGFFLVLLFLGLHRKAEPLLFLLFPLALIAGNFFCGWLCPLGTLQEVLGRVPLLGRKKKYDLPPEVQRYAKFTRYALLAALILITITGVLPAVTAHDIPINAYQSLFAIFDGIPLSAAAFVCLAAVFVLSLLTDRPFCNYLCIRGLQYAIPSCTRLFTIKRDDEKCIDCEACDRTCPMHIDISDVHELRSPQCINCFRCIEACPAKGALTYGKADKSIALAKEKIRKALGRRPSRHR